MHFRPSSLSYFLEAPAVSSIIRGQNFTVECVRGSGDGEHVSSSDHETIIVVPDSACILRTSSEMVEIAPRSIVVAPAGKLQLQLPEGAQAFLLTTARTDIDVKAVINSGDYEILDKRVSPIASALHRQGTSLSRVRTYCVDEVPFPAGNPRLKFFQSSTMSINWVEYEGRRNRTKLSPHAHEDFEQGSLAIAGDFVHHIRTPWTSNAEDWRDDRHIDASAGSMLMIPPELIHTTEGVGAGRHILVDVFAPPRTDFVGKGWVFNASDYHF